MMNDITALGYGLIVFALIVGVGTVILVNFGDSVANCGATALTGTVTYNDTLGKCNNASLSGTYTANPTNDAWANTDYLTTQLGQTGLAGWAPAIIAVSVGVLFLGAFLLKGKAKGRY